MPLYAKLITFLPPLVCWIFANHLLRMKKKSPTNWQTLLFTICVFIYTLSDAFYLIGSNEKVLLAVAYIVNCCTAALMPIMAIFIALSMLHIDHKKYHLDLLYFVPILWISTLITILFTTSLSELVTYEDIIRNARQLDVMQGHLLLPEGIEERTYRLYSALFGTVFYIVLAMEFLGGLIFTIYQLAKRKRTFFEVSQMLFAGGETTPYIAYATCFLPLIFVHSIRIIAGTPFMLQHLGWTIAYSIIVTIFLYCVCFLTNTYALPYLNKDILFHPVSFRGMENENIVAPAIQTDSVIAEKTESIPAEAESMTAEEAETAQPQETVAQPTMNTQANPDAQPHSAQDQELLQRIQHLMTEELLFLNPHITIEEVASELDTNRLYVSRAVNGILGITFREYLNNLRIEYAKKYMMAHSMETQESIAINSGFPDATSFNKKFRQVMQVTPREWMETQGLFA